MQQLQHISIVCVCDNHYAILLAALIKSVESNHHTGEILDFFIVEDGITQKNKLRIQKHLDTTKTRLKWFPISACLPKDAKLPVDKSNAPMNVYTRLFIPHFVPKEVKKVIYLDVDMIMLEDISKLWYTNLEGKIVAAVQDQFIQIVSRWGGLSNYKELGLKEDNKYFNSGLMIIDIEKWENADITNRVFDTINTNISNALYQDQYGLNAVLALHWFALDPLWNRFAYSEEERPFLIHFTSRKPIYKSYEYSERYKAIFYEYLRMTDWKNFKPIGEATRYLKKIHNILEKFGKMIGIK